MAVEKDSKGRFVKGHSGNPGGRQKGVAKLVRSISNNFEDYLLLLDEWVRDESLSVKERRECLKELLNRSMGMPKQHIQSEESKHIVIGPKPLDDALKDYEE